MKLRNLNGAIRKVEGAPTVGVMTPLGYIHVPVQKTGLLDALKTLSDDPQVETHMEVSEDGRLVVTAEGRAIIDGASVSAQHGVEDQFDFDLLDDAPLTGDALGAANEMAFIERNAVTENDPFAAEDACLASSDDLDDLLG